MLLHPPHHNNLTTASSSHHTPIPMSRIINQPSASSTANLPVRTRKNSSATFIQSTFGPSPRRGAKFKQRRVDGFLDGYLQTNNGYVTMEEWQLYLSNGFGRQTDNGIYGMASPHTK
jgi:hypothetical protein